jgi:hypothetical protein
VGTTGLLGVKPRTSRSDLLLGDRPEIADALGVLLLTWNQAFYRYGDPLHLLRLRKYSNGPMRSNDESWSAC